MPARLLKLLVVQSHCSQTVLSQPQDASPSPSSTAAAGPAVLVDASTAKAPLLSVDFPDPSILQDTDGTWYAFATASGTKNIQAARASAPSGPWTYLDQDLLPSPGPWTDGRNTWAPDIRIVAPGSYVMYYSGELANSTAFHCIGAATASTILGPYTATASPFACPLGQGGAIDPAGFYDNATARRYVVYKVDGNSLGHGGSCNNDVAPRVPTPIMLQEVAPADGISHVGDPVQILDRTDADGPLVEAPDLVRTANGTFVLFYSSHCWVSDQYSVSYATAESIRGPYRRAPGGPLIRTGDFNLTAPGGATSVEGGGMMVFHADCAQGRCMFGAGFEVDGESVVDVS
ncbi:glycosyl hydrolase family 43 protein [Podospora appendiculata]|uniref:Glycosyl hydrolase family 43 protein n=1 Tax=Podospora appendiculata TaxID=314037 RepID=A0AAE0X5C6_9PEZI|nr:glycosyl hydrolase family 43 protein [Podospora appendiculata]